MLAVLVYALAVAKCTTNSYHLDLIALAAFGPGLFSNLAQAHSVPWLIALLVSIGLAIAFKAATAYVIGRGTTKGKIDGGTLTIISFALFQALMVIYGLGLSNKAVSIHIPKNNLTLFSHSLGIPADKGLSILAAGIVIVGIVVLHKSSNLPVLLAAFKENPDLLVQFKYSTAPIFWKGTLLASSLAVCGGFLVLIRSSVGPSTAYSLFFLSFSVLLLVEALNIARIVITACLVTIIYNGVLGITDATHQPIVGSAILLAACGVRYFATSR